jgi:hypothetical protein
MDFFLSGGEKNSYNTGDGHEPGLNKHVPSLMRMYIKSSIGLLPPQLIYLRAG